MAKAKNNSFDTIVTPVNILWDGILLIPISGLMDSGKAQSIMESMLEKILQTEAKTIILDILGVAAVDSAVANHIVKMSKATKLMGCDCLISGISPAIAQTLVHLGVNLGDVVTKATLKGALELAFANSHLEVRALKEMSPAAKKKE
jgi:rsbT co-antagonist protein RsbR